MFDRGRFWSPVPDWRQVAVVRADLSIRPVLFDTPLHLVSGNLDAFLARLGLACCLGPTESCGDMPYALRLAPDRLLSVGVGMPSDIGPGRLNGTAVSEVSDGYLIFDIGGAGAEDLMRRGTAYDLRTEAKTAVEAATMLFAGLKVAIVRCSKGWRLHVERPMATALWHWLEKAC